MLVHVQKVLDGEYDIPYRHPAPVILDIGANVGSFAAWALKRWPGAQVHCYEPLSDNFALLKRNLAQFPESSVSLNNFAIGDPSLTRLYLGRNNCGEGSFYKSNEQSGATVEVETRAPDVLPKADIVKIDTEGSEIDILSRMTSFDFDAILLEYHSEANRRKVDALLQDFALVGGGIRELNRGTLKFVHKRLLKGR
ncbi:FkbM family methyltransferase [Methyloceanibacter sp.]|uniref:FkbM family methyltransferase n=1 Tax=Methyloceanibacter sp. TaxID=1965321 RepID=UPI003D6D5C68